MDTYDKYYRTENLFGAPYPELLDFFKNNPNRGTLLDLGCGQGGDAIPLARMGYAVVGIDMSAVGIKQMNAIAQQDNLPLRGLVADVYTYDNFGSYDFILLDSMFHFAKNDIEKETELIQNILHAAKKQSKIVFCNQDTAKKIEILKQSITKVNACSIVKDIPFEYEFEDKSNAHKSKTTYRMLVVEK